MWPQEWMMKMINEKQVGTTLEVETIKKIDRIKSKLQKDIPTISRSKIIGNIIEKIMKRPEKEILEEFEWV